jgi:hypothetical protein
MRRAAVLGVAFLAVALAAGGTGASGASGDGLPVGAVRADRSGVTVLDYPLRFVAFSIARGTIVAGVVREGGSVDRSTYLRGRYAIPAVALDASASGLSADGGTLALIKRRLGYPRASTGLAILDTDPLRLRQRITLRGDFSFDAISPDGDWLYLVEYLSARDPTRYQVRAYDVVRGRLAPDPIIDPSEPDERMGGFPITRAGSPHGRWAYTLYDGAGKDPFVHALDTVGRTAACIELRRLPAGIDLYRLRFELSGSGNRLAIVDRGKRIAVIDSESFRVSYPRPGRPVESSDGGVLWPLPLATLALLLGSGAVIRARRRRRSADAAALPTDPLPALTNQGEPDTGERLGAGTGDAADRSLHGDEVGALAGDGEQGVAR